MLSAGKVEEAERDLEDARSLMSRTGEMIYKGELYRLTAELHLRKSERSKAEALILEAIEIARAQNAKAIELRAATSYALLLGEHGQARRGLEMLESICGWFQEGKSSRDLVAAQVVIARLGSSARQRPR